MDIEMYKRHANVYKQKFSNIYLKRAIHMIGNMDKALEQINGRVIYATGFTHMSKHNIKRVENKFPVDVIINKRTKNGIFLLIPLPMPRFFLIKINNCGCLVRLFHELDVFLLIEYCVFTKNLEKDFLRAMENICFGTFKKEAIASEYIKTDDGYFIYGIDADNQESDTGVVEYVSYGKNAPRELIDFHLK